MRPVLFHIGEIAVSSFWTMSFLAFFVGLLAIRSEVLRRARPLRDAYDIVLWAYVGGWIGARILLIPTGWEYFVEDPIVFLLSSSGWVWYGGLIGGATAVGLWARSAGVPFLVVGDIVAPALAIGLAIGRIGCQLSGDGDYGVPTDLPWGMSYPNGVVPTQDRVHPAPLYEMLALGALFLHLWRRRLRNPRPGDILGRYLVVSSAARFLIEFVRRNPAWLLGLTTAQWISIVAGALGLLLIRAAAAKEQRTAG
jgi:phosphatidylglycerol:prolipoprotein diacylglycerol transferase